MASAPFTGTVTNPSTGKSVAWSAVQPVRDAVNQADQYGYKVLGTIGSESHLHGSGDHTAWSAGKTPGLVYAVDISLPHEFVVWFQKVAPTNYPTLYIDFINFEGKQYDKAGNRVALSEDQHLHLSIERGYEKARINLISDFYLAYYIKRMKAAGYLI